MRGAKKNGGRVEKIKNCRKSDKLNNDTYKHRELFEKWIRGEPITVRRRRKERDIH